MRRPIAIPLLALSLATLGGLAPALAQAPPPAPAEAEPPPPVPPAAADAEAEAREREAAVAPIFERPLDGALLDRRGERHTARLVLRRDGPRKIVGELRVQNGARWLLYGRLDAGLGLLIVDLLRQGGGDPSVIPKPVRASLQVERYPVERRHGVAVFGAVPGAGALLVGWEEGIYPATARSYYELMAVLGDLQLEEPAEPDGRVTLVHYGTGSPSPGIVSVDLRVDEASRTLRMHVLRHPPSPDDGRGGGLSQFTARALLPYWLRPGTWTIEVLEAFATPDDSAPEWLRGSAATLIAEPSN